MEAPDGSVEQIWYGLPSDFERAYLGHYHQLDPWMPTARSLPVGCCVPSEELVCSRLLDASEFYQDFLKPRGLREIVGGIVSRPPAGGITTFAVMRADGATPFSRRDASALEKFFPRIQRALWIDRRLCDLENYGARSRVATFVLDASGVIHSKNEPAVTLLRTGDAIVARENRLRATCPVSDATLAERIANAQKRAQPPGPLFALRRAAAAPLIATVTPLGEGVSNARVDGPRPGLLVLIFDPLQAFDLDCVEAKLRELYALTAAEARVAALVGSGHSPAEAAKRLGITVGTARFQLKRVYFGAELTGQRELVRLVSLLSRL